MKSILKFAVITVLVSFGLTGYVLGQKLPNILVILADDLGYHDVGFTGCTDIKTPQLDELASNGIVCTNGYVTHAFCGPSRAGLLTGRYQARFGMEINPTYSPFDLHMGLPLDETVFAQRLKNAGYRTGAVGKWHMGAAEPYHPNNRGFDHFYGFLAGGHDYFPSTVNTHAPLISKNGSPSYWANEGMYLPLSLNKNVGEFNEYLTTALSRNAAAFVRESDKPFLLYLAYNAPHSPLQAPKETIEKYKNIENKDRQIYAAMIDKMDEGIGMVIDALKESGKFDNTLIFFLSDNGGVAKKSYGLSVYSSNYPFREGKGSMYEGGAHVPFMIHWPKGIKKPAQFDGLVSSLDIAATACALAGADTTNARLDGVNLAPYLKGEKKGSPHDVLFWRADEGSSWAVRTPELKFLKPKGVKDASPELFDMLKDPYESKDIVKQKTDERKRLAKLWNDWNTGNKPIIWLQANPYQKERINMYDRLHEKMKKEAEKRPKVIIE